MNIVVLDGYTLNPGDLSWDELKAMGFCEIFDRTQPGEVAARAANAEIVITNKAILHRAQIEALPKLKYIGVTATGYNVVDIDAAKERGIVVCNVPLYGTRSVAQHTLALLLELTQHVGHHAQSVRDGRWVRSVDWCYWDKPLIELDGAQAGIASGLRLLSGSTVKGLSIFSFAAYGVLISGNDNCITGSFVGLSGDYNGVHMFGWYARKLGFPRAFFHPPRVLGQCLARLPQAGFDHPVRLDAWIKGPVFDGAPVKLRHEAGADDTRFALHVNEDERPAIVGHLRRGDGGIL